MEGNTHQLTETLQKISPIPLKLEISDKGNLSVNGDIKTDDLQPILDNSYLRYQLYLNHQKELERENNLTAIYIGFIFSFLIAIGVFCAFNQSPKNQNFQQSLEVTNHGNNV